MSNTLSPPPRPMRRLLRNAAAAAVVASLFIFGTVVPAQAATVAPFTITGRIVDAAGTGVSGATVSTPGSCNCGDIATIPGASSTTAADGSFSVSAVTASVRLAVTGPSPFLQSELAEDGVLRPGGLVLPRTFTASAAVGTLTLQRGVAVSGSVSITGFPAASGGSVYLQSPTLGYYSARFTTVDGTQTWATAVPQGSYTVSVWADQENVSYNGGAAVTVGASGANLGSIAVAGSGFAVRGTAVDPDGRPASGVIVDLYREGPGEGPINTGGVKTAADGTYTFPNVDAGQYKVNLQTSVTETDGDYGFIPGLVPIEQASLLTVGGTPRVITVPGPATVIRRGSSTEPRSVIATAGDKKATVAWQAPVSPGSSYSYVYKYTVTASPGGATVTTDGVTTSAVIPGLTNGTAYRFTVVATNGLGDSPVSATSNSVTPAAGSIATAPGAPTAVKGKSGDAKVTATWVAPASDGGSPVTGYRITVRAGDVVYGSAQVSGTARSAVVSGLPNGKALTVVVWAKNAVGESAGAVSAATVTPMGKPTAPTAVKATAGNAKATVTWGASQANGSAITGYTVTASPGGKTVTVASSVRTATVTGLTNGTAYTFTVTAKNAVGSTVSAPSTAVRPATTVPTAPRTVTATAGDARATVKWVAPSSNGGSAITGYTVTASPGGKTATVAATARTAVVTGLTNGTAYTFTVKAKNAKGSSAASAKSAAVTPKK